MPYLDFLLYVRVTPDFSAILSVVEFLNLLAISACICSSGCAMVVASPLTPEFLMCFFLVLWNLAVGWWLDENGGEVERCGCMGDGELKVEGS